MGDNHSESSTSIIRRILGKNGCVVRVIDLVFGLTIGTVFFNSRLSGFEQRPQVMNIRYVKL